jgi:sec-independent protein translocase protein TatC
LRAPAESAGITKLVALSPLDGFLVHFRIALYGGLFLSAPVWIFELTRFIAPALLPHEKRLIIPGIIAAMVLFLLGNVFGYYMLNSMMSVIFFMFGKELQYFPSADPFISFVVFFLVATGIAFELPIILLILIRIGWLPLDVVRRNRKIAYFAIFVFAELITPVADPFVAPAIVMMPMILLFELALLVARLIAPKPAPATVPPATS